MRKLSIVLAFAWLAACGNSDFEPVSISIDFRVELPLNCPTQSCADYSLTCGAVLSVRIFDIDSAPNVDAEPLAETCIVADPDVNLCSVADLQLGPLNTPARRVRVEVAMWQPEVVGSACPSGAMFDLAGVPLPEFDPPPAFAGAVPANLGDDKLAVINVPLACASPDPLSTCISSGTQITAEIDDLDTLVVFPDADPLAVSLGTPSSMPGPGLDPLFSLRPANEIQLGVDPNSPVESPRFVGLFPEKLDGSACLRVLEEIPQATATAACQSIPGPADEVDLRGFVVRKPRLDQILAAVGLGSFPGSGLVVGRVVDEVGTGVAMATVSATSPSGGSPQILYLSEDFGSVSATPPTASHGYFVSTEAAFGSSFQANEPGGQSGITLGTGLIQNLTTAVVIELQPQ